MPYRIYLPSSGAAPVVPQTWNHPSLAAMTYTLPGRHPWQRSGTALTSRTTATGTVNPYIQGVMRYVIGPLAATQISGTVFSCMRCSKDNIAANATSSIAVKIIQPTGADRAVLLAATASDEASTPYEYTTTLSTRRSYSDTEQRPITLTAQTPTLGDYLVIELGFRSATDTSYNVVMQHGDPLNTPPCVDADGNTSAYIPWVEFSADLPFLHRHPPELVMPATRPR